MIMTSMKTLIIPKRHLDLAMPLIGKYSGFLLYATFAAVKTFVAQAPVLFAVMLTSLQRLVS